MATIVAGAHLPPARELLSGTEFENAGILGAVESDFFDWVLDAEQGEAIVDRIARQVARFKLSTVKVDVLKGLYESLIDPELTGPPIRSPMRALSASGISTLPSGCW